MILFCGFRVTQILSWGEELLHTHARERELGKK